MSTLYQGRESNLLARRLLILLLIAQVLTHLFWLSPSVHSGQVAIPWMMNQGSALFDAIWEQHAPGSSLLAAAAQRLVNIDPALLVKLLNTLLVVVLTVMIYWLAKLLAGTASAGLLAALVWAWWAPVYGNVMLYFDTLLALCLLAALLIYFRNTERPSPRQVLLMGLLMGAATLFKQHAWLAVAIAGCWLLLTERSWKIALVFAAGALALPLLQWLTLLAQGTLESYIYWNWTFNLRGLMDGEPLDGDLLRKLLLSNTLVFPFTLLALRGAGRRQLLLALIWLSALTVLYPRFGEIHAMGHLPFAAVMSGIVLAKALPELPKWRAWDTPRLALAGLSIGIGIGWLWTGAASYLHTPLGPGAILAYDEFKSLAAELNQRKAAGDTLFALPETDSTPQLHPLTGMPAPGVWVKGWRWYFRAERVPQRLTAEWESDPPTWIVVFPALIRADNVGIRDLLAIVAARYELQFIAEEIYGHGRPEVYRLVAGGE